VTKTIRWSVIFFFASAGASSAYLTVSEVFPLELRAMAIAFFYAIGTLAGACLLPSYRVRATTRAKPKVRPASAFSISISSGADGKPASKHTSNHVSQCCHPLGMLSARSISTSPVFAQCCCHHCGLWKLHQSDCQYGAR
jgi:hypothetical protein